MSFTTPYTPHSFIQVWGIHRVDLVPVFWHYMYQTFSNNLLFCIFCLTEKYVYRWPLYFCQVYLKLKKIVKYIWDISFLWHSSLAHPDIRLIYELFFCDTNALQMIFTTAYSPHLSIQDWCKQSKVEYTVTIFTCPPEPNFGHDLCRLLKKRTTSAPSKRIQHDSKNTMLH